MVIMIILYKLVMLMSTKMSIVSILQLTRVRCLALPFINQFCGQGLS